jgi:predicted N-acetyltransferase YhbS
MTLEMILRQETKNDHKEVFNVIESAFKEAEFADNTEQFLVERLRKSEAKLISIAFFSYCSQRPV